MGPGVQAAARKSRCALACGPRGPPQPTSTQAAHRLPNSPDRQPLNYAAVGATRNPVELQQLARQGWNIDHTRVKVGHGVQAFRAATSAVQRWAHFDLGWAAVQPSTGTSEGSPVAVTALSMFLWTVNPLRVVWVAGEAEAAPLCSTLMAARHSAHVAACLLWR